MITRYYRNFYFILLIPILHVSQFKEIVFAIVEDHNSGHALNPNGNFEPFHQRLDCANLGPGYASLPQVTAPRVSTCMHGGRCDMIDAAHARDFYHPPFCPLGSECQSLGIVALPFCLSLKL